MTKASSCLTDSSWDKRGRARCLYHLSMKFIWHFQCTHQQTWCVCVFMFAHVFICTSLSWRKWRPELDAEMSSSITSPPYIWDKTAHWTAFAVLAMLGWPSSKTLESTNLCSSVLGLQGFAQPHACSLFHRFGGSKHRSSFLHSKQFTLSYFPAPEENAKRHRFLEFDWEKYLWKNPSILR